MFCDLKNSLQDKRPNLIFLVETRMIAIQMGGLVMRLGSGGVVCVPCDVILTPVSADTHGIITSWLCCGDFNEVLSIDENRGSRNILKTPRLVEPLRGNVVFTLKSFGLRMSVVW
ncbi:hypothetical protein Pyn_02272 [Prunus yedoensis var. nudiflora]|uniref:Uncharacterized protein n=1 Tax=Prunus yedoensis var. nudiflora TaxID=2094558 RepID=A0A314YFL2_PRUYE|nr:hypothetical protein Pyn_02272 [Prunus yedoensis var. nudiflora]